MKHLLLFLSIFLTSSVSYAQLPSQGILTYEVDTVRRLNPEAGNMRLESLVVKYKEGGKMCKIEASYPDYLNSNADQTVIIRNNEAFLIFRLPNDSVTVLQLEDPDLNTNEYLTARTQSKQEINALVCQKWVMTHKKLDWSFDVWASEQFGIQIPLNKYFTQFSDVAGVLVDFELEISEWLIRVKLKSVESLIVDNAEFNLPNHDLETLNTFLRKMDHEE